jgi:predicted transcriptional regulator of viral defense system
VYQLRGENMTDIGKVKNTIMENGGIIKTADLVSLGMTNSDVVRMNNNGFLLRVKQGYYRLSKDDEPNEEKIISKLFSDGIICMDSALFQYGYSDRSPLEWTLTFDRNISRSRLKVDYPNIKPYFVDNKFLHIGETETRINHVNMKIYDRERVICDCFRYKNKIDAETFNKAVSAYAADGKKNLRNLSKYAKELRVYKKVNEIIEVLIIFIETESSGNPVY